MTHITRRRLIRWAPRIRVTIYFVAPVFGRLIGVCGL